ncbi:MAG: hypothetical protein JXR59_02460 [Desulfuromonadaceae bacterium]|nr:hypothetical protein [Desulfuromonadaceae bacterium]
MKKLMLILAFLVIMPSFSFATTLALWATDTSIAAGEKPLKLSPTVVLSYDSVDGDSFALTGANNKGPMCYGVEAGNSKTYQKVVGLAASDAVGDSVVETAADDDDVDDDSYASTWSEVGK